MLGSRKVLFLSGGKAGTLVILICGREPALSEVEGHSCLCGGVLEDASTGRRASTPPREHRARRGPRCRCHISLVISASTLPRRYMAQPDNRRTYDNQLSSLRNEMGSAK